MRSRVALTSVRVRQGLASLAVLTLFLTSGLLARNPEASKETRSPRISNQPQASFSGGRELLTEYRGHRVYKVLLAAYQDDEFEVAGDTQWCWRRVCTHVGVTCEGGSATDVNGCTVRCAWGGVTLDVECPPR